MAHIIQLNTALAAEIAVRANPEDAALMAIGAKVFKENETFFAVAAGMFSKAQTQANADSDAVAALLATPKGEIDVIAAYISAQTVKAKFSHAVPYRQYFDDPYQYAGTAAPSTAKVMNYRDEGAGKSYRCEVNGSGDAGGGSIALYEIDETTGDETVLWQQAINTTTGYCMTHAFIVVPLRNNADTQTDVCVVACPPQTSSGNGKFKIWRWNSVTPALTTYESTATTGNHHYSDGFAYDTQKQCLYWTTNVTTNLRVLFSDQEQLTPSNAQCPRNVAFVSWAADIKSADMKTRMVDLTSGGWNNNYWRRDRLRWTNSAHAYPVGGANEPLYGRSANGQHAAVDAYFLTGHNLGAHGATNASNVKMMQTIGATHPTGSQPMLIKKADSSWCTETFIYNIDIDWLMRQGPGDHYHWWPERMYWSIVRWDAAEADVQGRCIAKGDCEVFMYSRQDTPSMGNHLMCLYAPQWWSTAKKRFVVKRMDSGSLLNQTYVVYHESFAY